MTIQTPLLLELFEFMHQPRPDIDSFLDRIDKTPPLHDPFWDGGALWVLREVLENFEAPVTPVEFETKLQRAIQTCELPTADIESFLKQCDHDDADPTDPRILSGWRLSALGLLGLRCASEAPNDKPPTSTPASLFGDPALRATDILAAAKHARDAKHEKNHECD